MVRNTPDLVDRLLFRATNFHVAPEVWLRLFNQQEKKIVSAILPEIINKHLEDSLIDYLEDFVKE